MAKERNKGKIFEDDFKKSVPTDCVCHRLKDSPLTYIKCDGAKYTHDNPCDFFVFDGSHGKLFALELKSTSSLAFTVQMSDDEPKKMIKYHQIKSLTELSKYPNVSRQAESTESILIRSNSLGSPLVQVAIEIFLSSFAGN